MPSYFRMVVDGSLPGAERWSCGINFLSDGIPPTQAALSGAAEDMLTRLKGATAGATTLRQLLSTAGSIDVVRLYWYSGVGSPAAMVGQSTGAAQPGLLTVNLPNQCSRVHSLLTGIPGKRTRGRFYWPNVTSTANSSGRDSSVSTSTATNVAIELGALALLTPQAGVKRPAVVSVAGGLVTPVTSLSIGNVIDTQRRRRDAIVEAYSTVLVP